MKKIHTWVAVIGIAVAGGGAWWWQKQGSDKAAATTGPLAAAPAAPGAPAARPGGPPGSGGPAAVEAAKVETLKLIDDVQALGTLKSRQSVVVRPEISGRIAQLGFIDGQRVRRGQLMVQLDDTLQAAQLKQAEAQSSIARTNLQRSRELQAQNFVSQSAVDQNAAALQVAEAQVALAQAQLSRMKILAPFDGMAGIRSVDVGAYVKDGADIVGLEDLAALVVEFALPERYVDRLRTGLPIELTLDALPGKTFTGRIEALDSQVDRNGRALLIKAQVNNAGAQLKPGMFARPRVVFSVREAALVVPEEALVPLGGRQWLFKVVDGDKGQKVSQRLEAKIGLRIPGKVEILEGLKAGDVVVTAGQSRLLRGDATPLRVIDLSKPAGGKPAGKPEAKAGDKPASAVGAGKTPAADASPAGAGKTPAPGTSGPVGAKPAAQP